jgi:CHAD domain-containing protein
MGESDLPKYLSNLVTDLRHFAVQATRDGEVDAIHDSRVTARRLGAALDLLQPLLPDKISKDLQKLLKRLRRKLGPIRDNDVMIEHVEKLRANPAACAGATWLADRLNEDRQALASKLPHRKKLRRAIAELRDWHDLGEDFGNSGDEASALITDTVSKRFTCFAAKADALAENRSDLHLHELRIEAKLLRYSFELSTTVGMKLPAHVLGIFKRLQDSLGVWRDFAVLGERILCEVVDAELPLTDSTRHKDCLELARVCARCGRAAMLRFDRLWRKHGTPLRRDVMMALGVASAPTKEVVVTSTDINRGDHASAGDSPRQSD